MKGWSGPRLSALASGKVKRTDLPVRCRSLLLGAHSRHPAASSLLSACDPQDGCSPSTDDCLKADNSLPYSIGKFEL